MISIKGSSNRFLWIGIYVLLTLAMGLIIILSVTEPQHNLFPWQMAVGTFMGFIFMITAFLIWDRLKLPKAAESLWVYIILLAFFGISLYVVSCIGRNSPGSSGDYEHVWEAAAEVAGGEPLSEVQEHYFKMYANNIKPMLFLSVIFRFANFVGFQDPFYFVLLISVLEVVGAAIWGGVFGL